MSAPIGTNSAHRYSNHSLDKHANERNTQGILEAIDRWHGALVYSALELGFLRDHPELRERVHQQALENNDIRVLALLERLAFDPID